MCIIVNQYIINYIFMYVVVLAGIHFSLAIASNDK